MTMVRYIVMMVNHTKPLEVHNHPTIWANDCLENAWWLLTHGIALSLEYTHRYGKTHSCHKPLLEAEILCHQQTLLSIHHLLLQALMNSRMTKPLISLLHIKDISSLNLGQQIIIFVTHLENQSGCHD